MPRYLAEDYLQKAIEHYQEFILFEVKVPENENDTPNMSKKAQAYRKPWLHAKPRKLQTDAECISKGLDTLCYSLNQSNANFHYLVTSSRFSIDRFEIIPSSNPASQESCSLDSHPFLQQDSEEYELAKNDTNLLLQSGDGLMLEEPLTAKKQLARQSHLQSVRLCTKSVSDPLSSANGRPVEIKDMLIKSFRRVQDNDAVEETFLIEALPDILGKFEDDSIAPESIHNLDIATDVDHEPQCADVTLKEASASSSQAGDGYTKIARELMDYMLDMLCSNNSIEIQHPNTDSMPCSTCEMPGEDTHTDGSTSIITEAWSSQDNPVKHSLTTSQLDIQMKSTAHHDKENFVQKNIAGVCSPPSNSCKIPENQATASDLAEQNDNMQSRDMVQESHSNVLDVTQQLPSPKPHTVHTENCLDKSTSLTKLPALVPVDFAVLSGSMPTTVREEAPYTEGFIREQNPLQDLHVHETNLPKTKSPLLQNSVYFSKSTKENKEMRNCAPPYISNLFRRKTDLTDESSQKPSLQSIRDRIEMQGDTPLSAIANGFQSPNAAELVVDLNCKMQKPVQSEVTDSLQRAEEKSHHSAMKFTRTPADDNEKESKLSCPPFTGEVLDLSCRKENEQIYLKTTQQSNTFHKCEDKLFLSKSVIGLAAEAPKTKDRLPSDRTESSTVTSEKQEERSNVKPTDVKPKVTECKGVCCEEVDTYCKQPKGSRDGNKEMNKAGKDASHDKTTNVPLAKSPSSAPLKDDSDDLLESFIKKRNAERAAEEEYVIRKIKLFDNREETGPDWHTPEKKSECFSPSTASTVSTPSEWQTVVIEVDLSDAYVKLLGTIAEHAAPRQKCLTERDIISANESFVSLQPQHTLELVQQYKSLKSQANSAVYKALSSLHILVTISHLVQCCSATVAVTELQDLLNRKANFAGDFQSLCQKLQDYVTDHKMCELTTHPKIFRMTEYIKKWRSTKDIKSPDYDNKILIIINNKSLVLMKEIQEKMLKVESIRPVIHPRKTLLSYQDVMSRLEDRNCLLIHTGDIGPDFPWAQFSIAIEYDPYPSSNRLELIARQNIRYVALQVNPVPVEKITAMGQTKESPAETLPEGSSTYIVSQRVTGDLKLCHALESDFNMQLIERDCTALEDKGLVFADVIIDERTCVVLMHAADFPFNLTLLKSRLIALNLKYSACWILVCVHDQGKMCMYGGSLIQQLSQIQQTISGLQQGLPEFSIKLISTQCVTETARSIKQIGKTALEQSQVWTPEHWYGRHWISPHISRHENFLLHFPCLNSFSAQILLTYAPLKDLFAMSQDSLSECIWLPTRTLQLFHTLAHSSFDEVPVASTERKPERKEVEQEGDLAQFDLGLELESSPVYKDCHDMKETTSTQQNNWFMNDRTALNFIVQEPGISGSPLHHSGHRYCEKMASSHPVDMDISVEPHQKLAPSQEHSPFSFLAKAVNEASRETGHQLPQPFHQNQYVSNSPEPADTHTADLPMYGSSDQLSNLAVDVHERSTSRKRPYQSQMSPSLPPDTQLFHDSPDYHRKKYLSHDNLRLWTQFSDRLSKKPNVNVPCSTNIFENALCQPRNHLTTSLDGSYDQHLPAMHDPLVRNKLPGDEDYRYLCTNYPVTTATAAPSSSTPVGRAQPWPRSQGVATDSPPMDLDRHASYWIHAYQQMPDSTRNHTIYYQMNSDVFEPTVNSSIEYNKSLDFGESRLNKEQASAWPRKLTYERVQGVSSGQTRLTFR